MFKSLAQSKDSQENHLRLVFMKISDHIFGSHNKEILPAFPRLKRGLLKFSAIHKVEFQTENIIGSLKTLNEQIETLENTKYVYNYQNIELAPFYRNAQYLGKVLNTH